MGGINVGWLSRFRPQTGTYTSRWPEWAPFIPVDCCPACSANGWLAELVDVASRMNTLVEVP